MTCQCNFKDIKDEDDDWEIQRLEDIITICEALIKHKKRQKNKIPLEELLKDLNNNKETVKTEESESKKDEEINTTTKTIKYPKGWIYYYGYPRRLYRYPWDHYGFYI